jgi:threonine/homoserine/homoserine lactone efflux protein
MRRYIIFLTLCLLLIPAVQAQTGGQFCVRAFEDRNANGSLDGGEPLLTRGISADLLNPENIIVASALLSSSPTAAQGVICFQFLAPGQYSMIITSADYLPTTPNTVTAAISEGTLPTVVEFGGQKIAFEPAAAPEQPSALPFNVDPGPGGLQRIVLSILGALVVVAVMIILGSMIYLLFVRRGLAPIPAYTNPTTGSLRPVSSDLDTDEIKPVR